MQLSRSEQATLHFYQWEQRGRGYYLFETPVDIEPPYVPFSRQAYTPQSTYDDGRDPSLLTQVIGLFKEKKEEEVSQGIEVVPKYLNIKEVPERTTLVLSFSSNYNISPLNIQYFLNTLSFSQHSISFEILATNKQIQIQIVCSNEDVAHIKSQIRAYFPSVIISKTESTEFPFDNARDIAISDFGLNEEYMRPIAISDNYTIDPLTSIIASLELLQEEEIALIQTIFKGVSSPIAKDVIDSVSDGRGGSFFSDSPEMLTCAKEKVSHPLFSVIQRIAVQGINNQRSEYLANHIINQVSSTTRSNYNKLIPLSNEGYKYDFHWYNVYHRTSNRLGFILNTKELATLVHYPNSSVVSELLKSNTQTTRAIPIAFQNLKYSLGINLHNNKEVTVTVSDDHKVRHSHIIGSTGTGKSTLLINMVVDDMNQGNGVFLFDPHGDIVEDVIARVPDHRIDDVILIDPSDTDFPIGFNLLHAPTELEKIVLSSDIVEVFKRYATAWGDTMTSVLSQAVNTFLESSEGGTLIELKRFLLEDKFRAEILRSVLDTSIQYYWKNEYPMVKKRIAPLITRIDTFLRPKIVRYMLAQKSGMDFKECIEDKKIVLFKLPQGLIGEENSNLLGSLFLSKINQVAFSRQSLHKQERFPFYVYIDECHNYINNQSILSILSGARKYGLGLVLAHQDLTQIDNPKVLNSVLSNPSIRICFRVGDNDARKLADGFTHFEVNDLQQLQTGQAIMRVGGANNDWNIATQRIEGIETSIYNEKRKEIVTQSRNQYGQRKEDIEEILNNSFGQWRETEKIQEQQKPKTVVAKKSQESVIYKEESNEVSEDVKKELIEREEESNTIREHRYIQQIIKKLGQERGFQATIEKETRTGGRVDAVLQRDHLIIAFEVSVTNKADYEVKNIKKCIDEKIEQIIVVSSNAKHLLSIEKLANEKIPKNELKKVTFISPSEIPSLLDNFSHPVEMKQEVIKGFRVTTDFEHTNINDSKSIREHIVKRLFRKK
jgi:hypothetical protein